MDCLALSGLDPSGGAGLLLDIKVFSFFNLKSSGVPTALTIQSEFAFEGWEEIDPDFFEKTLKHLFSFYSFKGIKIGMIGSEKILEIITKFLKDYQGKIGWIVFDPVLKASLNFPLFKGENFLELLKKELFPLVNFITPNLSEFTYLFEVSLSDLQSPKEFKKFLKKFIKQIFPKFLEKEDSGLILTGILFNGRVYDFFCTKKNLKVKSLPRVNTEFHGTGCAFSSAFLSYLVKGFSPEKAFEKSKNWLYLTLKKAEPKDPYKGGKKLCQFL